MVNRKQAKSLTPDNEVLLKRIEVIKADHPAWGYRRVWAYLKYREDLQINKKRVYRLLKENSLLAPQTSKNRAKRTLTRSKPRTNKPNKIWGIDMTKVMVDSWGWLYLHVVLDWGSKKIVGWHLSPQSKTDDWLKALSNAVNEQFPQGIRETGDLKLVSDNGSQPTSMKFMAACRVMEITQIFTSYNNPKGNADTERVIRTIKEDLIWPRDWFSFEQLNVALHRWVKDYNEDFPHSAINYKTPVQFEQEFLIQNMNNFSQTLC